MSRKTFSMLMLRYKCKQGIKVIQNTHNTNQVITQASIDVMTGCQLILGQDKLTIDVVTDYGATH